MTESRDDRGSPSESPKFNSKEANLRIKALSDKTRREIIGILYVNGPTFHAELAKRVGLKPNELSYHLGLLLEAGYLQRVYSDRRIGKSFSTYTVTDLAIKFLEFIDAKAELDLAISAQKNSVRNQYGSEKTYALEVSNEGLDFIEAEKIAAVMRMAKPKVTVIGVGGAGDNIVSWIKERGLAGGKLIAANTDAAHLSITKADRRILIGEKLTHGQGAGGYPQKGAAATRESIEVFLKETQDSNIVFICAGLGGGTGTGAAEVLSKELAQQGRLVIGVVTLPFSVERFRYDNAKAALKVLREYCDTVVAIDNTKLSKVAGDLPLQQALGVANELVGQFVKGITETITTASLINIDYADLRAICERKGLAAIGVGEAKGSDRVEVAIRQAIEGQLLEVTDVTQSQGVLVLLMGGEDLTLEEITRAGELVTKSLPPKVRIVWGARVDPTLEGRVKCMVMLTGVESTFLTQGESPFPEGPLKFSVGSRKTLEGLS